MAKPRKYDVPSCSERTWERTWERRRLACFCIDCGGDYEAGETPALPGVLRAALRFVRGCVRYRACSP